ncbi:MAG TPA: amidohydrolase family protein, partial [Caulobacteraceae bacterium]|nr:amidohydrolase family protein [Caulobacteraceae bacterium]
MDKAYDLVVRGGLAHDGHGSAPREADVAIKDGRIAAVGQVSGAGAEEIDARGKLVAPGFVDIHTHYDGQATWESRMQPSSWHGVTTVVMGNCGVGFAPCRPDDHDRLVRLMEGVEDIPFPVLTEGLPWNWESYPDYLNTLAERRFDVDIGSQLPHAALRVYVMGQRGVDREPATESDIAAMAALAKEAMEAGAIGFGTS